ncbi:DNA-binding response regulator [Bacteroidia bacterium]|nr:DNA-binding response regulator [Bacteroidia bacterium]
METLNQPISTNRKKISILLVEDNESLGEFLCDYLQIKGFSCFWAKDGEQAMDEFYTAKYNFCILDIMLPKKDGFSIAHDIRKQSEKIPILFLTAKNQEEDRIKGFNLGADDYMTKPFSMEELIMRINAIIRRLDEHSDLINEKITLGKIKFDFNRRIAYVPINEKSDKYKEIEMSNKESELVKLFCQYKNEVVYRSTVLSKVWANGNAYASRSMDVYINKVRKIFSNDPHLQLISIHGVGYKLIMSSNTTEKIMKDISGFIGRK